MSEIEFGELAQIAAIGELAAALLETTKRITRNEEEIVILRRLAASTYSHLDDIDEADVKESELRMGEILDKYEAFLMDNNRPQIGLIQPGNCFYHGMWDTDKEPHCPGCKAERAAASTEEEK